MRLHRSHDAVTSVTLPNHKLPTAAGFIARHCRLPLKWVYLWVFIFAKLSTMFMYMKYFGVYNAFPISVFSVRRVGCMLWINGQKEHHNFEPVKRIDTHTHTSSIDVDPPPTEVVGGYGSSRLETLCCACNQFGWCQRYSGKDRDWEKFRRKRATHGGGNGGGIYVYVVCVQIELRFMLICLFSCAAYIRCVGHQA